MLSGLVLCSMLAIATATDLDRRTIPNRVLAIGAAAAVAIAAADPPSLAERLVAALAGGGALLPVALARPNGFGMGDVKLIAAMGLFLGSALAVAVPIAFAAAALAGAAIVARDGPAARKRSLPFAPFLALGGLVALVAGQSIAGWYVALMLGR